MQSFLALSDRTYTEVMSAKPQRKDMKGLENAKIVSVISGLSTTQATKSDRFSCTLIFKVDGESIYFFKDKTVN